MREGYLSLIFDGAALVGFLALIAAGFTVHASLGFAVLGLGLLGIGLAGAWQIGRRPPGAGR